jgi:hypothetical protein
LFAIELIRRVEEYKGLLLLLLAKQFSVEKHFFTKAFSALERVKPSGLAVCCSGKSGALMWIVLRCGV